MSPVKEPNYFASEVRPEAFCKEFRGAAAKAAQWVRRFLENPGAGTAPPQGIVSEWEDYLKLFRNAKDEVAVGEASVCYLWSATAAANIRAKAPEARIIMILRDPTERAFSQYLNNAADGVVSGSFRQQIERAVRNTKREFQPLYPFLENGLYYEQVKRYLDLFPREQVRIFLYEEAWQDATRLLAEVFEFLGADAEFKPDFGMKELERRQPRSLGAHLPAESIGRGGGFADDFAGRVAVPSAVRFIQATQLDCDGGCGSPVSAGLLS